MQEKIVSLSVPAEADFARAVRMMASNLAVVCGMNVDEVGLRLQLRHGSRQL